MRTRRSKPEGREKSQEDGGVLPALFQVAKQVRTKKLLKTVTFQTRLKLGESAYFNRILKIKPLNQVAKKESRN